MIEPEEEDEPIVVKRRPSALKTGSQLVRAAPAPAPAKGSTAPKDASVTNGATAANSDEEDEVVVIEQKKGNGVAKGKGKWF